MCVYVPHIGERMSVDVEERVEEELELKEPGLWRVIMHNDDKTTMEFVVFLFISVFYKSTEQAMELTLIVHERGFAIAGIYTHEIAENKMNICVRTAREQGYPLNITIEEEL